MKDEWRSETQPVILQGGINMPYSWTIGRVGSRFFLELRDNASISANRCAHCRHVWVPPRLRCPICFKEIPDENWMEVGPNGTLRHFTVVRYHHSEQPVRPPFVYGIIDLDGTDGGITHLVDASSIEDLAPGVRLKPVFYPDREGHILDIAHFKPLGGEEH